MNSDDLDSSGTGGRQLVALLTLDIEEAALLCRMHPERLRAKAKAGLIPGCSKPGKRWVFVQSVLLAWIAGESDPQGAQAEKENNLCRSKSAQDRHSTGASSASVECEYERALGLRTERPQSNMRRAGAGRSGNSSASA